jgi:hypothetical protein
MRTALRRFDFSPRHILFLAAVGYIAGSFIGIELAFS